MRKVVGHMMPGNSKKNLKISIVFVLVAGCVFLYLHGVKSENRTAGSAFSRFVTFIGNYIRQVP